jgi:hypothetical protein
VDITEIRRRVRAGAYLVKRDAILHAVKEGFLQQHMVDAVLSGQVIESYPDRQRLLVCGPTALDTEAVIYLHVVCQYSDPVYIEFVTAYIPDETIWARPPFRRRKGK